MPRLHQNQTSHTIVTTFDEHELPLFIRLQTPGLAREVRQLKEFVQVDLVHSIMLTEQNILSQSDGAELISALLHLKKDASELNFSDVELGSLLFHIEHWLSKRIGEDLSGRLHTGRSRIDQSATVRRLYKRKHLLVVMEQILRLRETLVNKADQHHHTLMPGYTHMQHAQPWIFGHYLLSIVDRLDDDFERILRSFHLTNLSPLGAAGLVGTSWPLDRRRTAELLGFDGLVRNARLARDATYAADGLAAMSFIMSTINDLATDLHIWSSFEFGTVELSNDLCGTSSIFPQKKNPEALEMIRYAAGNATTWLGSALATFRGEGSGDQAMRELPQFDEAVTSVINMLDLSCEVISQLIVHADRMNLLLEGSWCTSSNLADLLVRKRNLSFRQAHHVVARLVSNAIRDRKMPNDINKEDLSDASLQVLGYIIDLSKDAIQVALSPSQFVATRQTEGAIAPNRIKELSDNAHLRLSEHHQLLAATKLKINQANQLLDQAAKKITETNW